MPGSAGRALHVVTGGESLPPDDVLQHIDISSERGPNLFDAVVPMGLIDQEDVPVDTDHVVSLKLQLEQEETEKQTLNGQIARIRLGHVPGHDKLFIVDGFHRSAALRLMGKDLMVATVQTDMSMEEVIDHRIREARNQSSVMFARIPDWINQAWEFTDWSERLSAVQAFNLSISGSSGTGLGLDPVEVIQITAWADAKATDWGTSPATIREDLMIAEQVDPKIIKMARKGTNFTSGHVKIIGKHLGGDYRCQEMVADVMSRMGLNMTQSRVLATHVERAGSLQEAVEIISSKDWRYAKPLRSTNKSGSSSYSRAAPAPSYTPNPAQSVVLGERVVVGDEALSRRLVMSEIVGARQAVGEPFLRGTHISPPLTATHQASFNVALGSDIEVARLLKPQDPEFSRITALATFSKTAPLIAKSMAEQTKISPSNAQELVQGATERILKDILEGDLRYVDLNAQTNALPTLLARVANDELLRQKVGAPPANRIAPPIRPGMKSISLNSLIEAVPRLNEKALRVLVMKGLLGLSNNAVLAAMGNSSQEMASLLSSAHQVVNRQSSTLAAVRTASSPTAN